MDGLYLPAFEHVPETGDALTLSVCLFHPFCLFPLINGNPVRRNELQKNVLGLVYCSSELSYIKRTGFLSSIPAKRETNMFNNLMMTRTETMTTLHCS